MSLGKFEFKKEHAKAKVNFLFDRNPKGSVHYYGVIEGIYLRNMDFFFLIIPHFYRILQFIVVFQWLTCGGQFCLQIISSSWSFCFWVLFVITK